MIVDLIILGAIGWLQDGHFRSRTDPSEIKMEKYSSRQLRQKMCSHDSWVHMLPDLFDKQTSHFTTCMLNSSCFSENMVR